MNKLKRNIKSTISERLLSKEYLLKYFILIYILIVLASLISGSIIFYLSNKSIENEIHKRNHVFLNNLITDIEKKYQVIVSEVMYFQGQETTKKLSGDISMNNKFHYNPSLRIISFLASIKTKFEGIKDVLLFFRDYNYLFTPDGMTSFDSYFSRLFLINKEQAQNIKNKLTSLEKITIENAKNLLGSSPFEDSRGAEYVIMTIPLTTYKNQGMTVSLIIDNRFFNLFLNNYYDIVSNLIIIDFNGNEIISMGKDFLDIDDIRKNIERINNSNNELRIKTKNISVSITIGKSELNKWTYIMAVPYSYIQSQTRYIKNIMMYTMLMFMIIGFIAAYKLGNWQYKPIETLIEYIRNIIGNQQSNSLYETPNNDNCINSFDETKIQQDLGLLKRTDEFAYIKESIGYLQSLNLNLKQFIDDSMPVIKQNIIYKLLLGLYHTVDCLEEEFEKYNINLKNKKYVVLILNYVKNKNVNISIKEYLSIRNSVTNIVMEFINKKFQGYSAEMDLENSAAVVGLSDDSDLEKLKSTCSSIVDFFNSQINVVRLTIGISGPTDNLLDVSKCYKDTTKIINNRSVSCLSEVVLFDSCSHKKTTDIRLKDLKIYKIISLIMEDKIDEASNHFLKSVKNLLNNKYTYDRLITISTMLHKEVSNFLLSKEISTEDIMQLEIMLLSDINNIYSIDEFNDKIKTYFNTIRDMLSNKFNIENNIIERIKAYVKENYHDSDLYLGKIALDMNVTANYISHIFKSSTGMSFPEYLTHIRMEKAKELLINTQEQISNISAQCGYSNVSTFIRSFKNLFGISPGKYREMYSMKQV